jgi:hypothetical protein
MKFLKLSALLCTALSLSGCALLEGVDVAALALKVGCRAISYFTKCSKTENKAETPQEVGSVSTP